MTVETQNILNAALRLPDDERADLAAMLVDSIGDGRPQAEIDAAWLAEAKRRLAAVRSGAAQVFASEDVERELDDIVAAAPGSCRAG